MTSAQIRQAFLDFFKEKQHTIVPSSSLMPDSPNLLFTNAGMNQFVPIFLGQVECPYKPGRAADTQKCIRAGGKHNDLDDVGLDTYHHTFFEMLGNWSFGDYFKKEAIAWSWELIVERFKFPAQRVYATIYQPDKGDPSERDQEAWDLWAEKFRSVGLDPDIHIVNGNKKDNFWMMGETGPCGPCSEVHIDLTPEDRTLEMEKRGAKLVNAGVADCIEIWNNVFIQFNANPDGSFVPLPAQHVDTGMGFERLCSIIQCTNHFADFKNAKISNYETDVFRPIFDEIEKLSGKKYGSTLPKTGSTGDNEQEKVDVAFRVIADHIRTLSFSIADGIQPGNNGRNYVVKSILRRAIRYGRVLGFKEPFFYKLVDVLAQHMGDVFPEIRAKKEHVKTVLKTEEEAFNRTLDKGIALFEAEAARLSQGERGLPARISEHPASASSRGPAQAPGARFWKRSLPHYERPQGIYHITCGTRDRRVLSPAARTIVRDAWKHFHKERYDLFAVCVMPDHMHVIIQPLVKDGAASGDPVFWGLDQIMHSIKSFTANEVNKVEKREGSNVWEEEYHDRLIRSDADLEEKFLYVCRNPWEDGIVTPEEEYEWLWTWTGMERAPDARAALTGVGTGDSGLHSRGSEHPANPLEDGANASKMLAETGRMPVLPVISGAFAFKLSDEQGFPIGLTELMARERGLKVDVEGFKALLKEQKERGKGSQKKQVIALSEIETKEPTKFIGYDQLNTPATVLEVVSMKDKTAVVLDSSTAYAEMGGQVGDSGVLVHGADAWRVTNTQKSGNTWLHFIEGDDAPAEGAKLELEVDKARRSAIERHHTVTHLLHWALHEVVSREAAQKGSFVGPDKLTFDFNNAALTPQQVRDVEKLVNERILENSHVSWLEVPYAEVKTRPDIMQFFGDKYGDVVRVVQIGGHPRALDGYSMELCGGTHTRGTGEIGLFRIVGEGAVAAGVRRIEAVAGLTAYEQALHDSLRIAALAQQVGSPIADLEKRIDGLLSTQKDLEKQLKSLQQKQAAAAASELLSKATASKSGVPLIAEQVSGTGDELQSLAEALKGRFPGVVVLVGASGDQVTLVASVSQEHTKAIQAGKIIQTIAPLVGGKGGGRPDFARGAGKDVSKIGEALAKVRELVG